MADYVSATISIGGSISQTDLKELHELCVSAGVGFEWNDTVPENFEDFSEHLSTEQPLALCDCEARWGEFESLEDFCRKHGLTYCRHNSHGGDIEAELVWWRPGMEKAGSCYSNENGAALIDISDVREALKSGAEKVAAVTALLDHMQPVVVPPLIVTP